MSRSDIIRITGGAINTVNDSVIGNDPVGNSTTLSQVGGMLGKEIDLDDSQLLYNSATGTVYGGRFRYVRLAAAATAVVVGQIVFWDISVADNLYQVTTSEAGSTDGAQFRAGIVLNNAWTPGNYAFIQTEGPTYVKYASVLSEPAAIGQAVYCGAFGAGANNGLADNITDGLPTRYLGAAIDLPVASGLKLVNLNRMNIRG